MKALIVEDDALVADAVGRALQRAGFETVTVAAGRAALVPVALGGVHLAVVDIDLPDMSGITLVEHWRRAGETLPILMVTAHDGVQQRSAARAAGASDYLTKPFEVAELIARCTSLCGHWAAPADLDGCLRRLLERLAQDAGSIVSCEHLANAAQCAPAEVDARVAELRRKLTSPARIRQVRGLGYRFG